MRKESDRRLTMKYWINGATLMESSPLLNTSPSSPPSKDKYLGSFTMMTLVWLLAVAGIAIALIVYQFFSQQHYKHFEDVLANMCDERARMLQQQFVVSMNHVHAVAILVSTFYHGRHPSALDQDRFAEYTARTAFERPLMTGVAYAHRVLHSEREDFERQQGWTIKCMHSKGRSPPRDEYAPTIFSQETINYIVSLDMMSGEEDRDNILRARASGKGVLTRPFRLLESNHLGVVLTFAVYPNEMSADVTPEERNASAAGYLGGAFDFESLVDNLLVQLARSEDIIVHVFDITDPTNPLRMYGPEILDQHLSHISSLELGDPFRKHEMRCRLANKIPRPTLALGFASGMVAFVGLICSMVYNAHAHVKKVEEDYRKMEELKVQAEAADIAKSQFLATVSHEIRTPMNGVLGMLQMLLDTHLDAMQQDLACTAQACGKALVTLINEVLDQAKIESGSIELEAVPFDVRAILDDVLSLFSWKTRAEGIELAVYVSDRVPSILIGDPGRIRQIITNLVGNSVKFTERGHIFVTVQLYEDMEAVQQANTEPITMEMIDDRSTCSDAMPFRTLSGFMAANQDNSWDFFKLLLTSERTWPVKVPDPALSEVKLFISVEDTGIGIPEQSLQRIFMPFMQVDSSTSRTYGGTGIGLSISKCFVELMNGQMWCESKENVGSTFSCSLILRRYDGNAEEHMPPVDCSHPLSRFRGMKSLVVDGQLVRAEVTKYHLQRLGVEAATMPDFQSAISLMLNNDGDLRAIREFDVVLVDKDAWGHSTGLNFPCLLQKAKQKAKVALLRRNNSSPKLILIATSITSAECEMAKRVGYMSTVIMKPLRAIMIASCLEQVLGMGKGSKKGRGIMAESGNLCDLLIGKKILVVDDNKVNQIVAAAALKKYGAHVECADSGKAAIAKLRPPHKFDACFMDIQMPEMDGFEATRSIRKVEQLANDQNCLKEARKWHIPILAMTADVIQATYDECIRCNMDGYVSKPFEEQQLYAAVSQVLKLEQSLFLQ